MWFTQVSLRNPVFATMVMLALVVLGLFSFQSLKVDQFPNIDLPVVVVTTEYPGASPEIVESEVSKKIEEAVNSIAGISALTSRSYEGLSVVVIEFQLYVNGRKAADDVREKVSNVHPFLRTDVKESRILRFDPSSRAIWSLAVLPDASTAQGQVPVQPRLTTDQPVSTYAHEVVMRVPADVDLDDPQRLAQFGREAALSFVEFDSLPPVERERAVEKKVREILQSMAHVGAK